MRYTETHEWVEADGNIATIGVSDFAQSELGDIVYVELPEVGKTVEAGDEAAVLESTKAAADVYSPVSGTIIAVNERLSDESELINHSAEEEGWIFKIEMSEPEQLNDLMDEATYSSKMS